MFSTGAHVYLAFIRQVVNKYKIFVHGQSMFNALMVNFDFLRKDLIADQALHTKFLSADKILKWKISSYKYRSMKNLASSIANIGLCIVEPSPL